MIKLIAFIPKRPDITIERFHIHWRAPHGEMAKGIVLFKRYVQGHRVASLDPGLGPTEYEGTAEILFDDLEAALAQGEDPLYAGQVGPDEANFIDLSRLTYLYLSEHVITKGAPVQAADGGFKLVQAVRRRQEMSVDDFVQGWSAEEPELAARLNADRHVCCLTLPYHYENGTALYDGVRELRWSDLDAYRRARENTEAWSALMASDVIDPTSSSSMMVEEFRLIWPEWAQT